MNSRRLASVALAAAVADARSTDLGALTAAPVDPLPPMQYPPLSQQQADSSGPRHGSAEA